MIAKLKIQQRQWPLIPVQEQSDTPALLPSRVFETEMLSCCSMASLDPFLLHSGSKPGASPGTSFPSGSPAPTRARFDFLADTEDLQ